MIIAKFNGKIVEITRTADRVAFSDERGWICICYDVGKEEHRKMQFAWIPASTRFDWVRDIG